jgi:hypothetical protein
MLKIKVLGQVVTVKFTTEPVLVDGQPAYAYADFMDNVILIGIMKETDVFNSFIHEYTHFFNRFTLTDASKDSKFNEEDRCHYVGNVVSALIRENGSDIFDKVSKIYAKVKKGIV